MEVLSVKGGVGHPVGLRLCGWHGGVGRFPGRHEVGAGLIDQVMVRLICEGWLPQDPCSSPGSHPKNGRGLAGWPGCP